MSEQPDFAAMADEVLREGGADDAYCTVAVARHAYRAGMEAAAKIADRHQDIVGWQPGESRNKLVGDIARAIRAVAARIRP